MSLYGIIKLIKLLATVYVIASCVKHAHMIHNVKTPDSYPHT